MKECNIIKQINCPYMMALIPPNIKLQSMPKKTNVGNETNKYLCLAGSYFIK